MDINLGIDTSVLLAFLETPTGALAAITVILTIFIGILLVLQSTRAMRLERDSSSLGFAHRPLSDDLRRGNEDKADMAALLFPQNYTPAKRPMLNAPDTR